jgi:hypothetical protein
MGRPTVVSYEILIISGRGTVLCSGGSYQSEHMALQGVMRALVDAPGATAWEIIKVARSVTRTGKEAPTNKELLMTRHR